MLSPDDMVAEALRRGWTLERGKKHVKLRSPEGRLVVLAHSCSDFQAVHQVRQNFRRAGLDFGSATRPRSSAR